MGLSYTVEKGIFRLNFFRLSFLTGASSVYHMTAVARVIDAILPATATPAVALAALG